MPKATNAKIKAICKESVDLADRLMKAKTRKQVRKLFAGMPNPDKEADQFMRERTVLQNLNPAAGRAFRVSAKQKRRTVTRCVKRLTKLQR
jgi:hypothetical protein